MLWIIAFNVVFYIILKQFMLLIKEQNLTYSLFHSKPHIILYNLFLSTSYPLLLPYPSAKR